MIMKRKLVLQNVHKAHFNDMKHDAYHSATPSSSYYIWLL